MQINLCEKFGAAESILGISGVEHLPERLECVAQKLSIMEVNSERAGNAFFVVLTELFDTLYRNVTYDARRKVQFVIPRSIIT